MGTEKYLYVDSGEDEGFHPSGLSIDDIRVFECEGVGNWVENLSREAKNWNSHCEK